MNEVKYFGPITRMLCIKVNRLSNLGHGFEHGFCKSNFSKFTCEFI